LYLLEKDAKKKKAVKKNVEESEDDDLPKMVKIVKYSNIDLSGDELPVYSKWIGSIL